MSSGWNIEDAGLQRPVFVAKNVIFCPFELYHEHLDNTDLSGSEDKVEQVDFGGVAEGC